MQSKLFATAVVDSRVILKSGSAQGAVKIGTSRQPRHITSAVEISTPAHQLFRSAHDIRSALLIDHSLASDPLETSSYPTIVGYLKSGLSFQLEKNSPRKEQSNEP